VRAVLDANVHISALLSAEGTPAQILRAFVDGRFELVVSPKLLSELQRALGYAKLQRHIDIEESAQSSLGSARPPRRVEGPGGDPSARSADPEDDYLLALATSQQALRRLGRPAPAPTRRRAAHPQPRRVPPAAGRRRTLTVAHRSSGAL
jgi:putative PIN family toxin of toxin-antitoxin system